MSLQTKFLKEQWSPYAKQQNQIVAYQNQIYKLKEHIKQLNSTIDNKERSIKAVINHNFQLQSNLKREEALTALLKEDINLLKKKLVENLEVSI
jgi:predicted RNase H-like nuclease (RuvC/YqgF family)